MLALIGAMDQEVAGLRRLMRTPAMDRRQGFASVCGMLSGKQIVLAQSGVGQQRAQRSCRSVLDRYPVTGIISFGFAGALNPGLGIGDIVACSKLLVSSSTRGMRKCDDSLLSIAQACVSPGCTTGVGITWPALVAAPSQKKSLFVSSGADIVDMESYWIAVMAADHGIPFITVRAISDTAYDDLPDLPSWTWQHVVPHFGLHPDKAFSLYKGITRAKRGMTDFLSHMIEVAG